MNKLSSIKTGSRLFFLLVLGSFFFIQAGFSQTDSIAPKPKLKIDTVGLRPFGLIWDLQIKARFIAADIHLNCYVITEKNEILSFGDQGQPLARYTNNKLGQADRIDVSNGTTVVVWYPDFQTAVWLNSSLTEIGRLDLRKKSFSQVKSIASASDNGLWVYDESTFQVKKFSLAGKEVAESSALNLIVKDTIRPTIFQEHANQVYLGDPKIGLLAFDNLGQYQQTLPLKGLEAGQFFDNKVMFVEDGVLKSVFLKRPTMRKEVQLPGDVHPDDHIFIMKRRVFRVLPDKIEAWIFGLGG